ncbi:osmosensitive K+ channel signal transduction histidine kinase domain protein [Burkholderia mallei]|nr:sensor histidine kinase in two-component regulatory system wtih KdpE, regulation of potassium translocation domain protein [Burkholderia pseudomallei]KOS78413.1 osmosensitive K+ channel signal transduction histidine kinase domain protein [Burkholderia mallei]KOT00952.1 osmosensitive K+ channel signal transduction histidine kinase domain protein [Burkholderia mallei]KOT14866.1 osmosensitive K+ channel signal transduction histidine kinase domain protein [Burkholderia mallei]KOT24841.1 osmosens
MIVTASSGFSIFCRTLSPLSGSSIATRARNTSDTCRLPISTICSAVSAAASSRAIAYIALVRRSRRCAIAAPRVRLDVRWLITSDVSNIPKKVSRYCVSVTENDIRGGTKK